jgi:hypothetical protein
MPRIKKIDRPQWGKYYNTKINKRFKNNVFDYFNSKNTKNKNSSKLKTK